MAKTQSWVFLEALSATTLLTFQTVNKIKVGGPIYQGIILDKDLLADILPPPEYIIETHLVAMTLAKTRDESAVDALIKKLGQLHNDYNVRHEFWDQNLPPGAMREAMLVEAYEPAVEYYKVLEGELIPAVRANHMEAANQLVDGRLTELYNQHRVAIDKLVEMSVAAAAQKEETAIAYISNAIFTIVSTAGGILGVTLLISAMIFRSIVVPIRALVSRLNNVAEGDGDLTQRVDENRKDELGELGRSFNQFVTKIHDLVVAVLWSTKEVEDSSRVLSSNADKLIQGLNNQTQMTTQVASAITEMSASVVEVARKTSEAVSTATQSGQIASQGAEAVGLTIEGMNDISSAVAASATSVAELGRRGEQIGRIIEVIDDIADQTNLLALNAAIEAARAGEHGRGFAVVADEVRKLADRTTKATREIADSIGAIQNETTQAVERMNQGTTQVKTGVERASKASESLHQIVGYAQKVATMIQDIAATTDEQSSASHTISEHATSIADFAQQAAKEAQVTSRTVHHLSDKSQAMRELIKRFNLNADRRKIDQGPPDGSPDRRKQRSAAAVSPQASEDPHQASEVESTACA